MKSSPSNYTDPSGHKTTKNIDYNKIWKEIWAQQYKAADKAWKEWPELLVNSSQKNVSKAKNQLESLISAAKNKLLSIQEFCGDFVDGYQTRVFEVGSLLDNATFDFMTFGNGYYIASYTPEYDIYFYVHDARAEANNKKAFDMGYEIGDIAFVLEILQMLSGAAGAAGGTGSGGVVVIEGYEVYVGSADVAVAGGIPFPGYFSVEKNNSDTNSEGSGDVHKKVKEIIKKIFGKYKVNGECSNFARELKAALEAEGIDYKIVRVDSDALV